MAAILLFTLMAFSPIFGLPRFAWLSMVIDSIAGVGGAGGRGGLGFVFALLDLEAIR